MGCGWLASTKMQNIEETAGDARGEGDRGGSLNG